MRARTSVQRFRIGLSGACLTGMLVLKMDDILLYSLDSRRAFILDDKFRLAMVSYLYNLRSFEGLYVYTSTGPNHCPT